MHLQCKLSLVDGSLAIIDAYEHVKWLTALYIQKNCKLCIVISPMVNGHYLGVSLGLSQYENKEKRKRTVRLKVVPKNNTKYVTHCLRLWLLIIILIAEDYFSSYFVVFQDPCLHTCTVHCFRAFENSMFIWLFAVYFSIATTAVFRSGWHHSCQGKAYEFGANSFYVFLQRLRLSMYGTPLHFEIISPSAVSSATLWLQLSIMILFSLHNANSDWFSKTLRYLPVRIKTTTNAEFCKQIFSRFASATWFSFEFCLV